jgi:hypothetical protein
MALLFVAAISNAFTHEWEWQPSARWCHSTSLWTRYVKKEYVYTQFICHIRHTLKFTRLDEWQQLARRTVALYLYTSTLLFSFLRLVYTSFAMYTPSSGLRPIYGLCARPTCIHLLNERNGTQLMISKGVSYHLMHEEIFICLLLEKIDDMTLMCHSWSIGNIWGVICTQRQVATAA